MSCFLCEALKSIQTCCSHKYHFLSEVLTLLPAPNGANHRRGLEKTKQIFLFLYRAVLCWCCWWWYYATVDCDVLMIINWEAYLAAEEVIITSFDAALSAHSFDLLASSFFSYCWKSQQSLKQSVIEDLCKTWTHMLPVVVWTLACTYKCGIGSHKMCQTITVYQLQ